jgi:hypothetical protein
VQNACSFCCSDSECVIAHGVGYICPAGNSITGRNCCIGPDAECGGNTQCCSGSCTQRDDGKSRCTCFPVNAFCDGATAHHCCSGSCEGGLCAN